MSGYEEYQANVAREGLTAYKEWLDGGDIAPEDIVNLKTCAVWLLEILDGAR